MFSKSKVSQSMIDAVNKVLGEQPVEQKDELLNEASPIKEPTPTGMRVYGSSYGNSAKAKKDQTKSAVDDLKGPKAKEMKEAAKPDFLDMDKDGNKKEPMKKAIADKGMKEELKGNQHKIDANHNNKIDGQDFKILRGKKKVSEDMEFANKLLETVRKSDVPAYLRKAKGDTPLTVADVKAPKKDSISAPENLAKARNEEVELNEDDNLSDIAKKHGMEFKRTTYGAGMTHPKHGQISINRYGEWHHTGTKATGDSSNKFASLDKHLSTLKEEVELDEQINEVLSKDASAGDWIHDFVHSKNPKFAGKSTAERKKMALGAYYGAQKESYTPSDDTITTDTLVGRMPGGKSNSFKSYKVRVRPLEKEGEHKPEDDTPETTQHMKTPAMKSHEVHEATIAGTSGWKPMKKDVKDKSGAVHTPMSRAKDLARQAFKTVQDKTKIKNETLMGKDGATSESKSKW
jgi:hypothetical protein